MENQKAGAVCQPAQSREGKRILTGLLPFVACSSAVTVFTRQDVQSTLYHDER